MKRLVILLAAVLACSLGAPAQQPGPRPVRAPGRAKPNYDLAAQFSAKRISQMVFSTTLTPNWFRDSDKFWYEWKTPAGTQYWIVDPATGSRTPAFDMERLAMEITQTVRGWVYEKDGYELPAGLVYMIGDDGTNQKLSVRGDGSFEATVQPRVNYIFLGTCKGFLNHVEQLSVDTSSVSLEHVLQFPLASITAPVLVRNVFYEFDSAELTPESTTALDSLTALLNENPNVTIELSSHCDYRGNDQYNERLSQRRAESVVRYLIDHGIAADRLTPKGYGEGRPKVVKRRIAEQYEFLHEGDTLTEAFIRALPNDSMQEACNALNRRTEFRVLRTTYGLFEQLKKQTDKNKSADDDKAKKEADEENSGQEQPDNKEENDAANDADEGTPPDDDWDDFLY